MWGNFYGVWKYEKPATFPFTNRQGKRFECYDDLLEYIIKNFGDESSPTMYSSVLMTCPITFFYNKKVQEYYERYLLSEKCKVKPFKNADSYDELPALYVDFCTIMSNEIELFKAEIRKNVNK